MVTDRLSDTKGGHGKGREPSFSLSYIDILDKNCPMYLMAGMSYEDYWDGDPEMAKYYRRKLDAQKEYDNFVAWLQGIYIYEAIADLSPILKPFVKNPEPKPYLDKPIALDEEERLKREEEAQEKKIQAGREAMERLAISMNQKFKERRES